MKRLTALLSLLFLAHAAGARVDESVGAFKPTAGPQSPDGQVSVVTDLPQELRMRNTGGMGRGGPGTGAGLCVWTSMEHAGRYQNEKALWGLQKWMTSKPGGGDPGKVDRLLPQYAPDVDYVQSTDGDPAFLELALRTRRMVCVTYAGRDDFYRGPIAHMVNLVYLDGQRACILDNNRPQVYVWMTREEFLTRWRGMGGGWALVFLHSPPPPPLKA
jgi:hypothetical protein